MSLKQAKDDYAVALAIMLAAALVLPVPSVLSGQGLTAMIVDVPLLGFAALFTLRLHALRAASESGEASEGGNS